jgi:AraC-like DNA-binding protein
MEEWDARRFGYELSLRADITVIFLHIMRKWRSMSPDVLSPDVPLVQNKLVSNAITYINENYAYVTETDCADALGVSPSYLSRVFKKLMKSSFSAYVNSKRLKEAENLLLSVDMSVTDIAAQVGFSTVSYFISIFRARHGVTPLKFRQSLISDAR